MASAPAEPRRTDAPRQPAKADPDRRGLDQPPVDGGPSTYTTTGDAGPLTVHVQVRIAVGGHADAVAAAQGHALRELLDLFAATPAAAAGHDAT
jgi:hypothetical protein